MSLVVWCALSGVVACAVQRGGVRCLAWWRVLSGVVACAVRRGVHCLVWCGVCCPEWRHALSGVGCVLTPRVQRFHIKKNVKHYISIFTIEYM